MIDHDKLEARWHLLATEGPKTVGVTGEFNPLKNPPSWYDAERFRKSQQLAKKYFLRFAPRQQSGLPIYQTMFRLFSSLNIAHFIGNILLVSKTNMSANKHKHEDIICESA